MYLQRIRLLSVFALQCAAPCGPGQMLCLSGDQCVDYQQLCDGTPHCRDASDESVNTCGEFVVMLV
uniref:Uncharacterized protein n=1 Tax=Poecilia latipinna TaxID=48699 RepID=A0A3B3TPG1_9TELE